MICKWIFKSEISGTQTGYGKELKNNFSYAFLKNLQKLREMG